MAKKGKGKQPLNTGALTEVDKTFFDLTIIELNKRYQRLENENAVHHEQTKLIESKLKILDQERTDVINTQKRILNDKEREIKELTATLEILIKEHQNEVQSNTEKIEKQKQEYKAVHEELSTKIKLQTGRLNALDEFKSQKDDLLIKIEEKNQAMKINEIRHKRNMYETARKFGIGKDTLKKDMEMQLLEISSVFQNKTQERIATTTHRVIRENIAINNELDAVLETNNKLFNENINMVQENSIFKKQITLDSEEKITAIERSSIQLKLISKLTVDHENIAKKLEGYKNNKMELVLVTRELDNLKISTEKCKHYLRTLEQNLHSSKCARNSVKTKLQYINGKYLNLLSTLNECMLTIKTFLKENIPIKQKARKHVQLLKTLLLLMDSVNEEMPTRPSIDSVESLSKTYCRGDLGFNPYSIVPRSVFPLRIHKEVQMGNSFEDLVAKYAPPPKKEVFVKDENETEKIEEEKEQEVKEEKEIPLYENKSTELFDIEKEEEIIVFAKSSELTPLSSSESEIMFTESVEFMSEDEDEKDEQSLESDKELDAAYVDDKSQRGSESEEEEDDENVIAD